MTSVLLSGARAVVQWGQILRRCCHGYHSLLLTGVVIAVMILWNGQLTAGYGNYAAAVIIHVVGTTLSGVLCLAGRRKVFAKAPFWAYLGGAIGVLSTLFNNYALAILP